jgi:hypothetical protein
MRQNLVGYLLQAIEPEEHAEIERHLAADPALKNDCELLRACLTPLAHDKEHHEPPQGLANRCCEFVYGRTEIMPAPVTAPGDGHSVSKRPWSWLDLSVAGAIALAVAVLFVPSIYQSQVMAQRNACQRNLADIGTAMASYSDRHGYYPVAQPEDRIQSAGIWAPTLVSQKLLPRADKTVICPTSDLASDTTFRLPSVEELQAMNAEQHAKARASLGGSYGATLGYRENGKYKRQYKGHQTEFPLASDAGGKDGSNSANHGGEGQNVLFEQGHVKYVTQPHFGDPVNNFYLNNAGKRGPGLDKEDAVLAHGDVDLNE